MKALFVSFECSPFLCVLSICMSASDVAVAIISTVMIAGCCCDDDDVVCCGLKSTPDKRLLTCFFSFARCSSTRGVIMIGALMVSLFYDRERDIVN